MDERSASGSDISKTNTEAVAGIPKKMLIDEDVTTEDIFAERTNRFVMFIQQIRYTNHSNRHFHMKLVLSVPVVILLIHSLSSLRARPESHLGLHSRLDLAPKRLKSRLSHHLMTCIDL